MPEGRQITSKDAAELPECIDEKQREAILEKIMTDSPFQLRLIPEAQQIASRAEGRSIYHLYGREETEGEKQKAIIPIGAVGNVKPMEVSILKTISGPTHLQHYVELDNGTRAIWYQNRKPVER